MTSIPPDSQPRAGVAHYFMRAEELFRDKFEIERLVTATENRILFLGRDRLLKRRVALRVHLQPDTRSRAWFESELQLKSRLDHPSLRTVYSAGYAGDWAYAVSQWIEGESLADSMKRGTRSIPTVLRMARDLAEAVEYAHSENAIIRRIIPTTVMLDRQHRAVITDLRYANDVLDVAGGDSEEALPFIAPEARGNRKGDPSCDIYGIGAILYFATTGQPPALDPADIVPAAEKRDACPAFLDRLILRALSGHPPNRYLTGAELVDEITSAIGEFDFHNPEAPRGNAGHMADQWEARLRRALGDDYELLGEIGSGGFGRVYRVRDLHLEREVALKVLHPHLAADPGVVERFQTEARLAAGLTHPHIVNIYDINERFGFIWYTMVYVRGLNLSNLVRISGPQPCDIVMRLLEEALGALRHAHENKVVHRDLKPENILISEVDGSIQIADFGLAVALKGPENFGGASSHSGTPEFAAPEQLLGGQVDARTDLYSLSLVAMFSLLGRPPFTGPTPQAIIAQQTLGNLPDIHREREDVPVALATILARAASREPDDRYHSAADFKNALDQIPQISRLPRIPWFRKLFSR